MGGMAKMGSIDLADDESDETDGTRGIDFGEGTVGAGSGAALELELFDLGWKTMLFCQFLTRSYFEPSCLLLVEMRRSGSLIRSVMKPTSAGSSGRSALARGENSELDS